MNRTPQNKHKQKASAPRAPVAKATAAPVSASAATFGRDAYYEDDGGDNADDDDDNADDHRGDENALYGGENGRHNEGNGDRDDDDDDDVDDDEDEDLSAATSAATTSALSGGGTLPIRPTLSARSVLLHTDKTAHCSLFGFVRFMLLLSCGRCLVANIRPPLFR